MQLTSATSASSRDFMVQYIEQSILNETMLRTFVIASLSAAAVLAIFDLYSLHRPWRRGEVINADKLSLVITISNLGLLFFRIPSSFSCWQPVFIWTVLAALFLFSRGINILFFVHRAKSVQGPNPVLSKKWLTKYIPVFVGTYYGITFLGAIYNTPTNPDTVVCVSNQFSYQRDAAPSLIVWLFVALELTITAVVTFLFVVPLWRLYRAGSGRANANVSVLKDALKYAVVLTAINLLSSSNVVIGSILYRDDHYDVWHYFGTFDPVLNIVTTIMVFKRNRVLLWKLSCHIWNGIIQMCCCAVVMETDGHLLDLQQAQRTSMAIMALQNLEVPNVKMPLDSITEFNDVTIGEVTGVPVDSLDPVPSS